jgi:pimeloyl-ACP methyl ester carboxylesterase
VRVLERDGLALTAHERGAGMPVVLQHGLCGDARQTFEAFPDLPDVHLVTLDCRGHGQSEAGGPYAIRTFADDVAALIATLPGPVVLGGISMGAAISLRLAVMRPDLVRGLWLVRPAWLTGDGPANMAPNAEVGRAIAAKDKDGFAAGATAKRLALEAPDNLASLMGFFDRQPLEVTSALLTLIASDGPGVTVAQVAALRVPTLVCGCADDAIHPLTLARELAAMIPGARFVEVPPKGRDKPAHLATLHVAITDFLKEF